MGFGEATADGRPKEVGVRRAGWLMGLAIACFQRGVHIDGLGPIEVRMVRHQESDRASEREARP